MSHADPSAGTAPPPDAGHSKAAANAQWSRVFAALLLGASVLLVILHYIHLRADFPHFSPWNDPARVTDEGWYAGAALRYFLSTGWRMPGDFNPAVALPVFPLIVSALFRFTGVSIAALRALNVSFFAASLLATWLLVRRYSHPLAAAGSVFLIACSPIYYAYSRLGTLEPLLALEFLIALLVASSIRSGQPHPNYKLLSIAVGILLATLAFTKTTGIFLYPAILYLIASRCSFNLKASFRPVALAVGVAAGIAFAYCAMVRKAGLSSDFSNLFAINRDRVHRSILLRTLWAAAKKGVTIGPAFYLIATAAIVLYLIFRGGRRNPLFFACVLSILGYSAFIVYHGWLIPRYYIILVPPLAMGLSIALAEMAQSKHRLLRGAVFILTTALLVVGISQVRTMIVWTRHPSYSYQNAANAIYGIIDHDPSHNRVVLSSISEQLALLTAEPGVFINPDYSTAELSERISVYKPGWRVTFNPVGPQAELFSQQLVDTEPLLDDDPAHNELFLYRLTFAQH